MKSDKKYLLLAIIFGLITVLLVSVYLNRQGRRTIDDGAMEKVVTARQDIPAYTVVTAEMIELVSLPAMAAHPGAVRDPEKIVGGVTRTALVAGEQVLAERVALDLDQAHFACRIPEGMRAVAIPVDVVSGVSGFVAPGDRVDVLVSIKGEGGGKAVTVTVMQDILVLAAGPGYLEEEKSDPSVVKTLALAVTPAQAQEIAYYTREGTFHLTLRFPADREILPLRGIGMQGGQLPQGGANSLPGSWGDNDHGNS